MEREGATNEAGGRTRDDIAVTLQGLLHQHPGTHRKKV